MSYNQINKAHGGEGWSVRPPLKDELGKIWNHCGVCSETDELKAVLLRRPQQEIENVTDPGAVLWNATLCPETAREQFAAMMECYQKYGVKIYELNDERAKHYPNIFFMRDTFTMLPEGAFLSRPASPVRAGEEVLVQKALADINVPIIGSGFGDMRVEGPDVLLVSRDLALLGVGLRTNQSAVDYVKRVLQIQGISEVEIVQTTFGCGHLDGVLNFLNKRVAVVYPKRISYFAYETLKRHGYEILPLYNEYELENLMSINFVPLNAETILINKGAKETTALYNAHGMRCEEVDVSELTKAGGSVHCMSGILWRA